MGEREGGLFKAMAEASHRCWAAFKSLSEPQACPSECRVSGASEQMQWVSSSGKNLFKWLVAQEEKRRSVVSFARIENSRPVTTVSKGIDSVLLETVPDIVETYEEEDNVEPRHATTPVTREELGRATWTLLHTLAAQYPEKPTRQQQKDVRELMSIISRMYPCRECADHFKEVLKTNPVQAASGVQLAQWMCRVHNVVNRSLGKPQFVCQRVDARWGALYCDQGACDLQGRTYKKP